MQDQGRAFDEIAALMDDRGMEIVEATIVATLMRKPARAMALKDWLARNPRATNKEISMQAHIIEQTVEPTRHGTPKK